MRWMYLKLELKRACKRLLSLYAGAAMLLFLAGMAALLLSRSLYKDAVMGKVSVGAAVPQEDLLAREVIQMVSSLESVDSLFAFEYMDYDSCLEGLKRGELYAVLEVPRGFVQDIMNGVNTPVTVWTKKEMGIEEQVFQELADAGARTLGAGQAGIYAGNELYAVCGLKEAVSDLEEELNRRYMDYSLGRAGYFKYETVQASGEVTVPQLYMLSAFVLFLLLSAIPVSSFLLPYRRGMRQKLTLEGVGGGWRSMANIAAMGFLLAAASLPVLAAAVLADQVRWSAMLPVVWLVACAAAASLAAALYQMAGTLLGGIMLLFFVVTGQHFLAGGFLPLVFLPASVQKISPWLPSAVLMDTMKMAITKTWDWRQLLVCSVMALFFWLVCVLMEVSKR